MKRFRFKNRLSEAAVVLVSLMLVMNGSAAVQALSQSDLNSIYGNSVWYWPDFSSVAFSCSSSGSTADTPGDGAPDGAAFPKLDPNSMASAINSWVSQQNPNSALSGLGSTIVASAKNSNVNPFLIAAIAKEETSMADPNSYNVKYANNPFSREATSSQPNYPGAGPNAGTLWYKWSSVKASVDYTAPENQNAKGGGDIATYIRDEYSSQLDGDKLSAMFIKYAPPSQNNTQQYIANVESWIQSLISLTNGGNASSTPGTDSSTSSSSTCSSDCASGSAGDAAILCEAKKYQGIYYLFGGGHESYSTFRQVCPEAAIATAAASSSVTSPGPCATDCSGLVSVAVDAAFNQNYVWTVAGSMQGDGAQYWESIDISDARAGDIVTTPEHVEIVDHVSGNSVYTFGSHYTGSQTGPITTSKSYWTSGAYHWVGPGGGQ